MRPRRCGPRRHWGGRSGGSQSIGPHRLGTRVTDTDCLHRGANGNENRDDREDGDQHWLLAGLLCTSVHREVRNNESGHRKEHDACDQRQGVSQLRVDQGLADLLREGLAGLLGHKRKSHTQECDSQNPPAQRLAPRPLNRDEDCAKARQRDEHDCSVNNKWMKGQPIEGVKHGSHRRLPRTSAPLAMP